MKLSTACLRITTTSSAVLSVLGHGTLLYPGPLEPIITPCRDRCAEIQTIPFYQYNAHWFTTGTAPGCNATVSTALYYDYVNRTIILASIQHELFHHCRLITWTCSTFSFHFPSSLCRVKIQTESGRSAKN